MGLADLIAIPNIAARLKVPEKTTEKVLGPKPDAWCEFHKSFGHSINSCLALGHQLAELVKCGFLKDYLLEKQADQASGSQPAGSGGQQHEVPIHGEIHTIAGRFSGGGCTASQRKRYSRLVMSVEIFEDHSPDVDITFTKGDLRDMVPHDNDPIVISLVTGGRTVHRVLVDQGSSADAMFWTTFEKLQLSPRSTETIWGLLVRFCRRPSGGEGVYRVEDDLHCQLGLTNGEDQVSCCKRPVSVQHTIGKANAQQNRSRAFDKAHEGQAAVYGGHDHHYLLRPEGGEEVLRKQPQEQEVCVPRNHNASP